MRSILGYSFLFVYATTVSYAELPQTQEMFLAKRRHLMETSYRILENNSLTPESLDDPISDKSKWLESYCKPMLQRAYMHGVEEIDEYDEPTVDSDGCIKVESYVLPYSVAPLIEAGMDSIFDRKATFPTYDVAKGETGVFDLNKPMVVNGKPQYVSGNDISNVKDTGKIRIAVVGDWGSRTMESVVMTDYLARLNLQEEVHYTFHLGDVYYAGRPYEMTNVMTQGTCRVKTGAPAGWFNGTRGSFFANGNHEMINRGHGYFETLLPAYNQKASYAMFVSEYYKFVMLDGAYNCLPEINSFGDLLEYVLLPSGNPNLKAPDAIFEWLNNPTLNIFNPKSNQSFVMAQHMQLVQPFVNPSEFGTSEEQSEAAFKDAAINVNVRALQDIMYQNSFREKYGMVGLWGHDHKSAYMKTDIEPKNPNQTPLSMFGLLMGQGGYMVDSPNFQPKFANATGMSWYDSAVYRTIDNGLNVYDIGYNGFHIITIDGPEMKIEYFRSNPHSTNETVKLVAYQVYLSHGRDIGVEEIEVWVDPQIQTTFHNE